MALRYYSNSQATALADAVTSVATNITVASTSGLPISYPFILILDRGTASEEVVLCTNAAGTSLSITRGYDSTASFAHAAGASVEHGIAAIDAREANSHVNSTTGVHGVTGALVGTSDAQALANKTLGNSNVINGLPAGRILTADVTGRLSPTVGLTPPAGSIVGTTDAQTLTNKTVALGSNTVTGTKAEFNAALTDGDFATVDGAETLTNKTLTSPTINGGTFSGTATGTANGTIKPGGTTSVTAIDFGLTSITVNASGEANVAHILGKSPVAVVATLGLDGSSQMRCSITGKSSTNFTVQIRNSATGDLAANNSTYGINWIAIA